MKNIKPLVVLVSLLIALTLIVPAVLVLPFSDKDQAGGKLGEELKKASAKEQQSTSTSDMAVDVAVFRSSKNVIENVHLEDYLVGVVAAEMPADFNEEAL